MDDEIGIFKRTINLAEYAIACGFEIDASRSSARFRVLRRGGEKILVGRSHDDHDLYYSARNQTDCGSIVDFVMRELNCNLGFARKELRAWAGIPSRYTPPSLGRRPNVRLEPLVTVRGSLNRLALQAAWEGLERYTNSYLVEVRRLAPESVEAFSSILRQDEYGCACFRHCDEDGITGWEKKNRGFTGFCKDSTKSIAYCNPYPDTPVDTVVICEAAIDVMSYYELKGRPGMAYASTGGELCQEVDGLQQRAFKRILTTPLRKIIATDDDEGGEKIHRLALTIAPDIVRDRPTRKDWNEALKWSKM